MVSWCSTLRFLRLLRFPCSPQEQNVVSVDPSVGGALQDALSIVSSQLLTAAQRLGDLPRDMARLRVFVILASCPMLEDPSFHDSVVARLCKAYSALKKKQQESLSHWFATVGAESTEDALSRLDDPLTMVLEVCLLCV
jgi:hypothetical protein